MRILFGQDAEEGKSVKWWNTPRRVMERIFRTEILWASQKRQSPE